MTEPLDAMNPSRRGALALLGAGTALVAIPAAAIVLGGPQDDAELLAMETEIMRLRAIERQIEKTWVEPHRAKFEALAKRNWKEACAFGDSVGRDAAIMEMNRFADPANALCVRLMTTPALTQAGRKAKVRVLLADVMSHDWRGPTNDLDWDVEQARAILGEFAGMTPDEMAAISGTIDI